jgi:hypothetical protein
MEDNEKIIEAVRKLVYYTAAGSIVLLEGDGEIKKIALRDAIREIRKNWNVIYVGKKYKDNWEIEELLLESNGFFKGIILGIMPRERVLVINTPEAISAKNLERIRYFYDENNLKSVIIATKEVSIINKFPEALKNRIGSRIIEIKE